MATDPVLRLVTLDDAGALQAACWPERTLDAVCLHLEDVLERYRRGIAWGMVALVAGGPVAYGQMARWGRIGEISDLVVAEAWRSQGIGSAVIRSLLDIARREGLPEVEIGANVSNRRAVALYRRLGFREKRQLMMEFGDGPEPVVYLSMRLDGASGASRAGQAET